MATKKICFIVSIFCMLMQGCASSEDNFTVVNCGNEFISLNHNLKKIYKPCRRFLFMASYSDSTGKLISEEKIQITATGNDWEYAPEIQDEIVIQYGLDSIEFSSIRGFNPNSEFKNQTWRRNNTTGIIETNIKVWMHPFRSNQYSFLQVSPFPDVNLPLSLGKAWETSLNIHNGWGIWNQMTIENHYKVISREVLNLKIGLVDCWHIKAGNDTKYGSSTHDFWFNEEYGFVRMDVVNYLGQKLKIQLIQVHE